jgi:hypothetical protein
MYFPKRHTCNACHFFYTVTLTTHEIIRTFSFLLLSSLPAARHDTRGCCGAEKI